jgi:hypothetical protein
MLSLFSKHEVKYRSMCGAQSTIIFGCPQFYLGVRLAQAACGNRRFCIRRIITHHTRSLSYPAICRLIHKALWEVSFWACTRPYFLRNRIPATIQSHDYIAQPFIYKIYKKGHELERARVCVCVCVRFLLEERLLLVLANQWIKWSCFHTATELISALDASQNATQKLV